MGLTYITGGGGTTTGGGGGLNNYLSTPSKFLLSVYMKISFLAETSSYLVQNSRG